MIVLNLKLQLKPVERYAINFLENEYRPDLEEGMKAAEVPLVDIRETIVFLVGYDCGQEAEVPAAERRSGRLEVRRQPRRNVRW